MIPAIPLIIIIFMSSCTMFERETSSDELQSISEQVIKTKTGVEIDIKPTKS